MGILAYLRQIARQILTINTTNVDITGQVSLGSGLTAQGAVSLGNTLNVSGASVLSTLRATSVTTDSIDSGSGTIQTTGAINGGTVTTTGAIQGGSISTTGTLSGGAVSGTSFSTSGTISGGAITGTSIDSGSGTIQTTGAIQGGTIQPNNKVKAQSGDLVLEEKDGKKYR